MKNAARFFNQYIEIHPLGDDCQEAFVTELAAEMGLVLDGRAIYLVATKGEHVYEWKREATFEDVQELVVNQLMSKGFNLFTGFDTLGYKEREEVKKARVNNYSFLAGLMEGYRESEKTNF